MEYIGVQFICFQTCTRDYPCCERVSVTQHKLSESSVLSTTNLTARVTLTIMPTCAISHRAKTGVWSWSLISLLYRKAESCNRLHMYRGINAGSLIISMMFTLTILQSVCVNAEGHHRDSPVYMMAVLSYMRDRRKWSKARARITFSLIMTVHDPPSTPSECCLIVFVAVLLLLGGDIETNPGPNSPVKSTLTTSDGRDTPVAMTSQPHPPNLQDIGAMDAILQRLQQMEDKNTMTSRRMEESLISRLEETQSKVVDSLKKDMHELKESLSSQLTTKTDQLQEQCSNLQKENHELKGMINDLSSKCDYLENHNRRNNLLFFGLRKDSVQESWGDCEKLVRVVLSDGMGITENIDIERAHRTKNNAIIVKLLSFKQRSMILSNSRKLKRSDNFKNVTVREDFSALVRSKRRGLGEMQKAMYEAGKRPKMRFDKLITSDGVYTYDIEQEKVVKLKEWEEAPQLGEPIDRRRASQEETFEGGAEGGEDAITQRPNRMLDWGYDPFGFPAAGFPPLDQHQHSIRDDTRSPLGNRSVMSGSLSQNDLGTAPSETRARSDSHRSPVKLRQRPVSKSKQTENDSMQPKINLALGLRGNTAQGRSQGQQPVRGGEALGADRGRGGFTNTSR